MLWWRRQLILRKFQKLGATSEDKGIKVDELKLDKTGLSTLEYLIRKGSVKKVSDDRYYIPCEDRKHG